MNTAEQSMITEDFDKLMDLSPDKLDALMLHSTGATELDDAITTEQKTEVAKEGDTVKATESSEAPAAVVTDESDVKVKGVLAKDGEHIIPFKVFDDLRTSEAAQKERVKLLERQLDEATQANAKGVVTDTAEVEMIPEEQLAALEAELPELAKTLRAQQNQIKALHAKTQDLLTADKQREQERAVQIKSAVQSEIDANPKLLYLQTSDANAFQAAKRIDLTMAQDPVTGKAWNALPLSERFAKVVGMYEAAHGAIPIAANPSPKVDPPQQATTAAVVPPPKPRAAPVMSLSDIPGGSAPAADSRAELVSKSGAEVIAQLSTMSLDNVDKYLAALM